MTDTRLQATAAVANRAAPRQLLADMPAHDRLRLAATLVQEAAYDQATEVDPELVGTLIRLAAELEDVSRRP
ncbi:hypothetical protein SAMN05444722_0343 [Rhodovulum sp. ES.010]|uniref:hypothetical protein n=1 Tax=Rhodovulum sp. ES.010 TaxID=1882821 RepID=UPI000925D40E|nr:hypothetical protein [Rhodovulum sp. ES.010]SIO08042.1 hypothetical protein SAMN05444722_0343 [Rhodovulum sp. ES.010]